MASGLLHLLNLGLIILTALLKPADFFTELGLLSPGDVGGAVRLVAQEVEILLIKLLQVENGLFLKLVIQLEQAVLVFKLLVFQFKVVHLFLQFRILLFEVFDP